MSKPATNQYPIHDLLKNRWSPRGFSSDPVESEKLLSLFEAARWSPSGGNMQPWNFIVVTRQEPEMHDKFVSILTGKNALWAGHVPVLILAIAKTERQPGMPNPWSYYDLGQAVAHLNIEAGHLGLAVHQMGGFDHAKAREVFQIPEGYEPVTAVAIGYLGDTKHLSEELQSRELETRVRKPLNEFVFEGGWGQPLHIIDEKAVATH